MAKWVCIVPPVILSRAFVTPNANYMSTVYAPYHGRTSVTDGTMRVTRANGPLPHQRRRPDLETFYNKNYTVSGSFSRENCLVSFAFVAKGTAFNSNGNVRLFFVSNLMRGTVTFFSAMICSQAAIASDSKRQNSFGPVYFLIAS